MIEDADSQRSTAQLCFCMSRGATWDKILVFRWFMVAPGRDKTADASHIHISDCLIVVWNVQCAFYDMHTNTNYILKPVRH